MGLTDRTIRLWRGEETLARTFWEYAIVYGTLANAILTIATLASVVANAPVWTIALLSVFTIPYNVFIAIAVWRSAARYQGRPEWATLARVAVIVWAVIASAS